MSKVLVIPDVHLKPWMFDQAKEIMVNTDIERAVCVGDLVVFFKYWRNRIP